MRASLPLTVVWTAFAIPVFSECRHPNGNIQTDAFHAPCAEVLGNPLNTMCCAIDRSNPPGGVASVGPARDECLPNGLCKQAWRDEDNGPLNTRYYREECTVDGWKNGSCLSVCLSNSASSNVLMTPCDDTANSTRWCCGENKDCCAGEIGVETLAQTFLGPAITSTSSSPSTTASTSSLSSTPPSSSTSSSPSSGTTESASSSDSAGLSAGAIAGIVVGAVAGVALIFAAWFFISRRRRNAGPSLDESKPLDENEVSASSKAYYPYEADANERHVSELPSTNTMDQNQKARVHELQ